MLGTSFGKSLECFPFLSCYYITLSPSMRPQTLPVSGKERSVGALAIGQVSRVFALSFEKDLICAVFSKTNAKRFVLSSVNGNYDNLPIVAWHKAFVDMVNN